MMELTSKQMKALRKLEKPVPAHLITEIYVVFVGQRGIGIETLFDTVSLAAGSEDRKLTFISKLFFDPRKDANFDPTITSGEGRCMKTIEGHGIMFDGLTAHCDEQEHSLLFQQFIGMPVDAYVLAYDVTNRGSFEALHDIRDRAEKANAEWRERSKDYRNNISERKNTLGARHAVWCVLGSKTDDSLDQLEVQAEEGDKFARSINGHFLQLCGQQGECSPEVIMTGIGGRVLLQRAARNAARERDALEASGMGPDLSVWKKLHMCVWHLVGGRTDSRGPDFERTWNSWKEFNRTFDDRVKL